MGRYRHHAIVVTVHGYYFNHQELRHEAELPGPHAVRDDAVRIFGPGHVSDWLDSPIGGFRTFLICPDGSKEGWEESEEGDHRREEFRKRLFMHCYEDGSSPVVAVEVEYPGDGDKATALAWKGMPR